MSTCFFFHFLNYSLVDYVVIIIIIIKIRLVVIIIIIIIKMRLVVVIESTQNRRQTLAESMT